MHTLHGVALNIFNHGVLLTGDSAIGKSELGLELISRGHQLIADDSVLISKADDYLTIANPHNKFFMHIRDLGFINILDMFGQKSVLGLNKLALIIQLNKTNPLDLDPLAQRINKALILNVPVTQFELSMTTSRPLSLLVEIIVKHHQMLIREHTKFVKEFDTMLHSTQLPNTDMSKLNN